MGVTDAETPLVPGRTRLIAYYAALVIVSAALAIYVLSVGTGEHAAAPVAGGYDVLSGTSCLGPRVDLAQSGRYVDISNNAGSVSGQLELHGSELTGGVHCATGGKAPLTATLQQAQQFEGTIGTAPLSIVFERDPPAPGSPKPLSPPTVYGSWTVSPRSVCLGTTFTLDASSKVVGLTESGGGASGLLRYSRKLGTLTGPVRCRKPPAVAYVSGTVVDRSMTLTITPGATPPPAPLPGAAAAPVLGQETVTATKFRSSDNAVAAFFLAVVVVMLAARLMGAAAARIGQPRVMGEVIAGIVLGPTVLGAISPDAQAALFPSDIVPTIGVAANLGLIFFMFLVGLELDFRQLRGQTAQTAAISNTGVLVPMMAGLFVALPLYHLLAPHTTFVAFALFMGVAMSITAFPVLARIVAERRMLKTRVGTLALAAAAIDDVTAWFLIAIATAVALAGGVGAVLRTIALAVAFTLVMVLGVRRLLARASVAFDEAGSVPGGWIVAIFAGVLLAAYTTQQIGIAVIFGAFMMGAVMPRNTGLTEDVTRRLEDFVLVVLLPLFFAYTGLRTNVGLLNRGTLVLITLALIAIAIVGKFGGAVLAARVMRRPWRESAVLGALMNTRGLTELIVLNLALQDGAISQALFSALVVMALVTTFMTGPLLRLLDRDNRFATPIEDELEHARRESLVDSPLPVPERAILVAPQSDEALGQLIALAEPLARSEPPRELILARLIEPPRLASARGAVQTESRALGAAFAAVQSARAELIARRTPARAVAFTSKDVGADLVRLALAEELDLLMLDGSRSPLTRGVPRGVVGTVLAKAPCDVAVLVARGNDVVVPGPDAPLVVPFGGAEHDWAALELAAWLASATGAPLKLLGAAGQSDESGGHRDASRLLANASLLVQRFAGLAAEPLIAEPGRDGILAASEGAGLLAIGLSERWRSEGLGATRAEIAKLAPAPILFVRRGLRPGALAPREDVTRFTWSSPAIAAGPSAPPE